MAILSVGSLADLRSDINVHKPDSLVLFADQGKPFEVPGSKFNKWHTLWLDWPADAGADPTAQQRKKDQAMMQFLHFATSSKLDKCHIACPAGNGVSMAAAYVMLCMNAKVGQEANAAIYLRFEAAHGAVDRNFVEVADRIVERQGAMVRGLDTMLPANTATRPKPVRFDLAMLSMSAAS